MYRDSGRIVLSASDLLGYLACGHFTTLSRAGADAAAGGDAEETDPELAVMFARGLEHEAAYLEELRCAGFEIAEICGTPRGLDDLRAAEQATLAAMRRGVDIVFQASFLDEAAGSTAWRGHADFLRRIDGTSALGAHRYEPEDTKLARHVKPSAVLQLCHYAEHLERLQGVAPEQIHVVLGGQEKVSLRLTDFASYYRAARDRFSAVVCSSAMPTYPEPVAHCGVCRWSTDCDAKRLADDHLSLVAGLGREQARKLRDRADIITMAALAASSDDMTVRGIGSAHLARLQRQSRLQVASRADAGAAPRYELLAVAGAGIGLAALPAPSPGDVFFDIEGDPYVEDGGLEYLLGVGWVGDDGRFDYSALWGHTPGEEKRAFEMFVDLITERRRRWPDMHVYHYAPYEPSALGRLAGRHGTREEEVDDLLRHDVLVDLYRVVRQGVAIGTASYSLKKLEPLYMAARQGAVNDGGSSIVEYERWLQAPDPQILADLEAYNRVDCDSTRLLRDWLELRRAEAAEQLGEPLPRPRPAEQDAAEAVASEAVEVERLVASLTVGVDDAVTADAASRGRWLLAQLLAWHRREDKPEWWHFFRRVDSTDQELYEDTEAVAGLEYEGVVATVARSAVHRYRFDPQQEHKLPVGRSVCDPRVERARLDGEAGKSSPGVLVALDPVLGTLDLKRGTGSASVHPTALIPGRPIESGQHRAALRRLAVTVLDHGIDGDGPDRAIRDLLLKLPPRVRGVADAAPLRRVGEGAVDAAVRLAVGLDRSYLPIQGPPGSGKTYAGAQMVVALVRAGKRVGITAQSHKVIGHLLAGVMECAAKEGVELRALQKADDDDRCAHPDVECTTSNADVEAALRDGEVDVVAGTSWLFARPPLAGQLDHLVVDEAGQLSLANVAAVAGAADNLVLIGDPQQLSQPSKGSHPPGAELSALEHILDGAATIAPERGLFLNRTRRLHPDICTYISELAYDGRLQAEPWCAQQTIHGAGPLSGSGLRWLPVDHGGNRTSSEEECAAVGACLRDLLRRMWSDGEGRRSKLTLDDVLVVAPYNAQVSELAAALPSGARVGTVDKFQGQEAAVVVVSLAASTADDVPRGVEFLYSRNRLNVAVSRAQALAVLVASPRLLEVQCRSVEQLRLANGLCRYVELAKPVSALSQTAGAPVETLTKRSPSSPGFDLPNGRDGRDGGRGALLVPVELAGKGDGVRLAQRGAELDVRSDPS